MEAGVIGGNDQVGVQQHGGADAGGVALYRHDDGFIQSHQGMNKHHRRAQFAVVAAGRVRLQEVLDIVARAVAAPFGGNE